LENNVKEIKIFEDKCTEYFTKNYNQKKELEIVASNVYKNSEKIKDLTFRNT